ncbi:MAG: hypothetical protein QXK67_02220 [Pyrobaculum sp.]
MNSEKVFANILFFLSIVSIVIIVVTAVGEVAVGGSLNIFEDSKHGVAKPLWSMLGVYIFATTPLLALVVLTALSAARKNFSIVALSVVIIVIITLAMLGVVKISH